MADENPYKTPEQLGYVLLIIMACAAVAVVVFWFRVVEPGRRYVEFYEVTWAELETLAKKRPPDLSREQWHHIVAWTLNGHANILAQKHDIPQTDRDEFVAGLKERLAKPRVDLATIDWIWDQFERLSPGYGPVYSERYRPTSPERLRQFQQERSRWVGVEVD